MPTDVPGRILPLSAEAIAQIHSSKHITSLGGVILALLENSLDAEATRVDISVDWRRGGVTVIDNGIGIPAVEFGEGGGLGKLYCTSKRSVKGIQSNGTHGTSGTFLAELAALSLLRITSSCTHGRGAPTMLTLHHGKAVTRGLQDHLETPVNPSRGGGTEISVRDLFGNMPVRVKQRALAGDASRDDKSWQELKHGVVALLLAWPKPCSVTMRDESAGSKRVVIFGLHAGTPNVLTAKSLNQLAGKHIKSDLHDALPILFQSGFAQPGPRSKWIPLSASTSALSLKGLVCLDPAPTKLCQFLALGITPCNATEGRNELYDVVAKVFSNSSFGIVDELTSIGSTGVGRERVAEGQTGKQLQAKKGVDRFPMYYIQLKFKDRSHNSGPDPDRLSDSSLKAVVDILEAALISWLESNCFRPRKKRRRRNEDQGIPCGLVRSLDDIHSAYPGTVSLTQRGFRGEIPDVTKRSDEASRIFNLSDRPLSRGFNFEPNAIVDAEDLSALSSMRFGKTKDRPQTARHNAFIHEGDADVKQSNSAMSAGAQPAGLKMTASKRRTLQAPSIDTGELGGIAVDYNVDFAPIESPKTLQRLNAVSVRAQNAMRGKQIISRDNSGSINDDELLDAEEAGRQTSYELNCVDTDERNNTITWTDPMSKQVFHVNSRTGAVLPSSDERQLKSTVSPRQQAAVDVTLSSMGKPLSLVRRSASAGKEDAVRPSSADNATWLPDFLKRWKNPVFARQKEEPIPVASFDGLGPLERDRNGQCCVHKHFGSRRNANSVGTKLTKSALRTAEVIAQVDTKFILCKMLTTSSESEERRTLILIDQHAASERVRLENLLAELCAPTVDGTSIQMTCLRSGTARAQVPVVELSAKEIELFARYRPHFARWGILYDLVSPEKPDSVEGRNDIDIKESRIRVTHLPTPVAERCANFPSFAIEMLRSEVWALEVGSRKVVHDVRVPADERKEDDQPLWLSLLSAIPPSLLALLNSRSCRSAIMFNDVLSRDQCIELVEQLGRCVFPFVCAHGRVSVVPLGDVDMANADSGREHRESVGQAMEVWLSMSRKKRVKNQDPVQDT